MSITEISAEQLAELFHLYHEALAEGVAGRNGTHPAWSEISQHERKRMVAAVRLALAPLFGERNEDGEFIFPLPPSARIDTLLLGCTHYPLLAGLLRDSIGDSVAIVDSATATASSLAELLSVNALEAPGTTRGTAADAGLAGHEPPDEMAAAPTHRPSR